MSSDILDEWDESFLEQAIQLELDATCSRNPIATTTTSNAPPPPHPLPQPNAFGNPSWTASSCGDRPFLHQTAPPCPPFGAAAAAGMDLGLGFSPPRELSQRLPEREAEGVVVGKDEFEGLEEALGGFAWSHGVEKDREIERLKREVKRVSKQLTQKEHECSEHQKDKARKNAELKSAFSQLKAKDAEINNLKMLNLQNSKLDHLVAFRAPDNPDIFTDQGHHPHPRVEDTGQINGHTKEVGRVVSIGKARESPEQVEEPSSRSLEIKGKETQSNVPSVALDLKMSSTTNYCIPTPTLCFDQRLDKKPVGVQTEFDRDSSEDGRVPYDVPRNLFAIWGSPYNSTSGGHVVSKLFFTCSTDFCEIFRSISHPAGAVSGSDGAKLHCFNDILVKISKGMEEIETLFEVLINLGMVENVLIVCRSLRILKAALQIMLGCQSRSHERFGLIMLESLPKYLHKDAGLHVQYEALQLLFLLLNCSELLQMFCKQCEAYYAEVLDAPDRSLLSEVVKPILEALAGCLMRKGKNIVEVKLQKKAVIILAFISSLGNSSAEVLRFSVTPQGANFMDLITQLLASEIDEADGSLASQDLLKERFALMREALILLNRLAANASCSKAVLGSLTRSHASASLTVHVASRISQKSKGYWKYDGAKRLQVIEAEVIDLARSFRARVLSFIAGSIS